MIVMTIFSYIITVDIIVKLESLLDISLFINKPLAHV